MLSRNEIFRHNYSIIIFYLFTVMYHLEILKNLNILFPLVSHTLTLRFLDCAPAH